MPFIQPRLSSKTVESIWTEAATSVVCNQSGCHNKATKVWDTPVKGSQVGYCDEHEGPATKAQPKTAGAKVYKTPGGKSWAVRCDTNECRSLHHMEGLTHEGATQQAATHNKIHHSKTDADGFTSNPHYEGWDGKDPMATTPKPGPDCNCERCVNDPYSPRNRARTAFTHDEIDWTDIEPGSPECASLRPSDLEETRRIIRREDERRKTPRDTPDRRQSSTVVGYSTDKELEGLCAACKGPLNSFSKTVDGKRYCSQTCAESKTSTRRTAIDNWDAIMQSPELKAVWSQVRSLASQVISAHQPQDEDGAIYGISSSDINHTVFSYAQRHWNGTTLNVGGLIHDLMDEADNSW